MVRLLVFLSLLLLVSVPAFADQARYLEGELLLILAADTPLTLQAEGRLSTPNPGLAAILDRHGLLRQESLIRKAGALSDRDRRYVRVLSDWSDFEPLAAARELHATGLFRAVSPNYLHELFIMPNDHYLSSQWYIHTGNDADIDLPEAWDVEQGGPGVVIAILDTGLDWSHPDLSGNAWHNPGEIWGNGLDDDGNGYVDDVYGWDCGENDNDPRPDPYYEMGLDVGFHGTHCAGIASATTNNSTGIAGGGWACSLMGLKLTSAAAGFSTAAVTTAFLYAIDEGVDVISMSFGGSYQDFGFMQSLVNDATAAGVVCVAAAGNNNNSQQMYPAALANVLSVGATNSSNQRASFSTYGYWVDVAAPGEHIWSTVQTNYTWDLMTQLLYMMSYGWDGVNPYMYCDGTSMACPLVAGVCGLVRSAAPGMSAPEVAQRVIDTGEYVSYDQPIGVKVNAFAAVDGLAGTPVPGGPPPAAVRFAGFPNPFNPRTTLAFTLPADGHVRLGIFDAAGRLVTRLIDGPAFAGENAIDWDGRDAAGRRVATGLYFARLEAADLNRTIKLVMLK